MSKEVLGHLKRYEADCNSSGEWFVFDNEDMYCMAGPLEEEDAIDMTIQLNNEYDRFGG
jgi:hypothetical protein